MTTIQIPNPPVYADIQLPDVPTISSPILSVDAVTEPVINDPTGSLRAFTYARYASIINDLLDGKIEELFTWAGDDELFNAQTQKDKDAIALELLDITNSIMSDSSARGFMFIPGKSRSNMLRVDREAKAKMMASGTAEQKELTDVALQFIQWAADAGTNQVRIGVDENKRIVYANIEAMRDMIGALLETQQQRVNVFNDKAKLYDAALKSLNTDAMQSEVLLEHQSGGIMQARHKIRQDDILLDQRHAENLGTALNNASTLVQAQGCLQGAELERQKVLQSQAVIAGFLAKIKEVHAGLTENRAEVETVIADLDYYKSEAKLADLEARNVLTEINNANSTLNQYYQLSMAQVKKAKADISSVESRIASDKSDSAVLSENYRKTVREQLVGYETNDIQSLTYNKNRMTSWIASIEGNYTEDLADMRVDHRIEKIDIDSGFDAIKKSVDGCAKMRHADWASRANTELQLLHEIR